MPSWKPLTLLIAGIGLVCVKTPSATLSGVSQLVSWLQMLAQLAPFQQRVSESRLNCTCAPATLDAAAPGSEAVPVTCVRLLRKTPLSGVAGPEFGWTVSYLIVIGTCWNSVWAVLMALTAML